MVSCHLGFNILQLEQAEKLYGAITKAQKIFPNTGSGAVIKKGKYTEGMIKIMYKEKIRK